MKFQAFSLFLLSFLAEIVTANNKNGYPDLKRFKVVTKVVTGNKKFDGLYMQNYHTGAGTADVTFATGKKNGVDAYFNNTALLFDYHFPAGEEFIPFAMSLEYATYSAWAPVRVNPGYGQAPYGKKFYTQRINKIVSSFEEWNGWLVCDWAHQVPQLFWIETGLEKFGAKLKVLDTCAVIPVSNNIKITSASVVHNVHAICYPI